MMSPIRILATTACRSDFDLLSPVYQEFDRSERFDLQLIVSGAHLSPRFGNTVEHVRATGMTIAAQFDTLCDSEQRSARPRTAARWIEAAAPFIENAQPNLLIAVGDREDALATCLVGSYLRIPVAHFFGGDHGDTRDVDNLVRHASSKLASVHFVMTDQHRDRLLAIGEPGHRIHVVGHPALDAFRTAPILARAVVLKEVNAFRFGDDPYGVVLHHPTFSDGDAGANEMELILRTAKAVGIRVLLGLPNTDAGARSIMEVIDRFVDGESVISYRGLGRGEFINLLRHAAVLIGNSSAGLLEAPSIPLPVVNVGERQRGRTAARNVLFVDAQDDAIREAMMRALSSRFRQELDGLVNPYGNGQSARRVLDIIESQFSPDWTDKVHDPLKPNR